MMAEGKRFVLNLTLDIKEIKDDGVEEFFNNSLTYNDIGYEGVVAVEQVLAGSITQLSEFGVVKAMELGLGEQLTAMGLGEQVAAMAAKVQ
jgi:hypothetical protein